MTTVLLDVDGRPVRVSSPERVLWPLTGTSKADLLEYYLRVAPVLLPHLVARPLTLHRFPTGIDGPHFYQTRTPPHPPWVRTLTLSYPRTGKTFEAPVVDDVASLVWAVNLTTIELHPFLGRAPALDAPTSMVLDLDPGHPAGLVQACEVALLLRRELDRLGLVAFPKTSGGKGLHLVVPTTPTTYDATKSLARRLAEALAAQHPDRVVARMTRALRPGRVFVDWGQNDAGKTTVAPWSVRGTPTPAVSTPVTWAEVERAVASRDPRPLHVAPDDVPRRLDEHGDLFAPVLHPTQHIA